MFFWWRKNARDRAREDEDELVRICFLIRSLEGGGAERQLVTLVRAMDKSRFNITVMTFYDGGIFCADLREAPGVTHISLNKRGRWDIFRFFVTLVRELRRTRPQILHGYLGISNILSVLLRPFLKKTRVLWGVRASNMDLSRYDWLDRLTFLAECCLSRYADTIIANSRAGKDYYVRHGVAAGKVVVISNGIDTSAFHPDPEGGRCVRNEFGVADKETLIGLVGRLDPMKDHPTFLRAAALVCKENPHTRFLLVHNQNAGYERQLRSLTGELGIAERILWAGTREDMPAVHNAFDIACSASCFGEGFPNVIGEAMACGVPCVVTDVGDSAYVVGETGLVAPPGNPEALANALLRMIARDRRRSGIQARQRILDHFTIPLLIDCTQQALDDLVFPAPEQKQADVCR